jgi:hypothetical protein
MRVALRISCQASGNFDGNALFQLVIIALKKKKILLCSRLQWTVKNGDRQRLAMEFWDVLCEHGSARYAHERFREKLAGFHDLPPGGGYPCVIEKIPQLLGRGHSWVFRFPLRQCKGVRLSHSPLPVPTFWLMLYGLP